MEIFTLFFLLICCASVVLFFTLSIFIISIFFYPETRASIAGYRFLKSLKMLIQDLLNQRKTKVKEKKKDFEFEDAVFREKPVKQ